MNPFTPSFGTLPQILLERNEVIQDLIKEIDNPMSPKRISLVYGLRGVGKTAFLTDVSKELRKKSNWIVLDLGISDHILDDFITLLYRESSTELQKALDQISGIQFSIFGFEVGVDRKRLGLSGYQAIIEEMMKKLNDGYWNLFVTIDEVDNRQSVKDFVTLFQLLLRKGYLMGLMMTGLPSKLSELQNNDVLTFLLRSYRIELEPINFLEIRESFYREFKIGGWKLTDDVLEKMVNLTNGYAYAFQLLGYLVWKEAKANKPITLETIEAVLPDYRITLFKNVHTKLYSDISKKDREFLYAMACSGKDVVRFSEIVNYTGQLKNYLSVYRRRLLDSRIIKEAGHGQLEFTIPYFKEYILEYHRYYDNL